MRNFILLFLPLFLFSYYDFSLRKYADISELTEDSYTDYYLNPAMLADLKERFISVGIYGSNQKTQFAYLSFVNPNKILPYALIFTNLETEFSSEKGLAFLFSRKLKDYSYGFKFQIKEIRNLYEVFFDYESEKFRFEKEGPIGDSTEEEFYFDSYYFLEREIFGASHYYRYKSNLLLLPTAFSLKFKDLEVGIDLQNAIEKRTTIKRREEWAWQTEEEYEYTKEGDTALTHLEEQLTRENSANYLYQEEIEDLRSQNKDVALFLRKKIKGIKEKKIFFTRLGYSFENIKGNIDQKNFYEIYESSLEWEKNYEDGYWQQESLFFEESKFVRNEKRIMIKEEKENIYQEGGFGFNYYLSLLKLDNTIFLGIKEKIDLVKREKEWEKRGQVYCYFGNNFEKGKFSFFPIFIPYLTIEENKNEDKNKIKISYNYKIFFDLKFQMFDFLTGRFSYLLPGEKEVSKNWVLSIYLNY